MATSRKTSRRPKPRAKISAPPRRGAASAAHGARHAPPKRPAPVPPRPAPAKVAAKPKPAGRGKGKKPARPLSRTALLAKEAAERRRLVEKKKAELAAVRPLGVLPPE